MTPESVLVFELYGDYAQFRKFFTNMSPLSFSIPPRTVISGIIGAIVGIDKQVNPEVFNRDNSFIALQIINPVRKTKIAHNYLKTTSMTDFFDVKQHKPTNVEYIKDARFRVYFAHADTTLYDKVKALLQSHQTIYTISLGISGCLANYDYLGEFELQEKQSQTYVSIASVIPSNSIAEIDFTTELNIQKANIPIAMKNDREVTCYDEVIYEVNGKAIPVIINDHYYEAVGLSNRIHEF